MAGLTRKGKVYYALFAEHGKTKWVRIGEVSSREARKALADLESEYYGRDKKIVRVKSTTFNQISCDYLIYSRTNKAYDTWQRDITSMKSLTGHFGQMRLESIDDRCIEDYKSARQKKGRTNRTINIELVCLSCVLKKAVEWGNLKTVPPIRKLVEKKKPPRYLTKAELSLLIESASTWMKYILLVLRNTGLRSKQLRNLKIDNANFDVDMLTVLNTKSGDYYVIPMTEELKTVLLYLTDYYVSPLGQISIRQEHQQIYFFCNPDGTPVKSFRNSFGKAVRRAGLKNVSPHTLRHTFASQLIMSGVDLPTVKELLGHKDIRTTMIYAHLSYEHKAEAVNRLSWSKSDLMLIES